ncbi:cysteine-rich repeat secretory protein 38-like isoform X2 [Diospyros lotus]|uniref:cysteine-rich repeat secretory protein 38-like isoform X2 n=1 Tax=Diospyros lotus TaxID=55363 RepID=UPI0022591173|nr:cysteine-rich repeat secretory protein 38-like isoform X2 [Diospyros lotus]
MHYFSSNPFLIIPFLLFFPTTCVISAGPRHLCFGKNSTSPTYESNLNDLADLLQAKVPPTGFGVGSVGQGQTRANGLALCRGDTLSSACKACVVEASRKIRDRCPTNKAAIIWYDTCLYKYSNEAFFGQIDNKHKFYLFNTDDAEEPDFNEKTKNLLTRLVNKAYTSPVLYATGEQELGASEPIYFNWVVYGLVQCTRDLSGNDCKKCLEAIVSEFPDCCEGKQGGRIVGGSCNFRYEVYPFINTE